MKKTIYGLLLGFLAIFSVATVAPAMAQMVGGQIGGERESSEGGNMLDGDSEQKGDALLTTIKKFINWALGMLATIALVVCLYAGFLMVTSAGDDAKYKKGMEILKQAGIGLVIIGLAWLIVSVIFWIVGTMSAW